MIFTVAIADFVLLGKHIECNCNIDVQDWQQ